jgi:hypothetical protein
MSLRNGSHLPTTQCACVDFATQRNGGSSHEKDILIMWGMGQSNQPKH